MSALPVDHDGLGAVPPPSLARIDADLAAHGWHLRQAQPRGADHLLLQLSAGGSEPCVGQWFADPARAAEVARRTDAVRPGSVARVGQHALVQRHGADRRLPQLAALLAVPGTQLVAHRPERRAVLRTEAHDEAGDVSATRYVKVLRPGRAAPAAATLRHLGEAPLGPRVPRVLGVDDAQGLLVTEALPGRTLHELLPTGEVTLTVLRRVGALVRQLHGVALPDGAGAHTAADEASATRRAVGLAATYDALARTVTGDLAERLRASEARLAALPTPTRAVPLHRDLHDKQLLLAPGHGPGSLGLIDLDLLAVGDPALDLGNLVAHLELRAAQGLLAPGAVGPATAALLEGYGADATVRAALPTYVEATRLRLVGVYAFRPTSLPDPGVLLR